MGTTTIKFFFVILCCDSTESGDEIIQYAKRGFLYAHFTNRLGHYIAVDAIFNGFFHQSNRLIATFQLNFSTLRVFAYAKQTDCHNLRNTLRPVNHPCLRFAFTSNTKTWRALFSDTTGSTTQTNRTELPFNGRVSKICYKIRSISSRCSMWAGFTVYLRMTFVSDC